mmetsp:Transcript_17590/g.52858  ORF Transcript_17590/g.52858 Transcript_17590/m.52858 type:complete len:405 (-) Transcript_17590:848-2062(-)
MQYSNDSAGYQAPQGYPPAQGKAQPTQDIRGPPKNQAAMTAARAAAALPPGPVSTEHDRSPMQWRFKDVDWKYVFGNQLWATALVTIIPVICLGIIHWAIDPRIRPYNIYDATISYPNRSDTIPVAVAVIVPFVLIVLSLLVGEFILFRRVHRNVTEAVATMLHFFIDICVAFLFTIFMTELTKVATGVLRPDFLAKCELANIPQQPPILIGGSGQQSEAAFPCTASDKVVKDARLAFVSGHASSATVFAFYHCGYFIWTVFYRSRPSTMTQVVKRRGRTGSFLKDFGQALAIYWVLILIMFAWFTGVSRIIDNKHSTADVVGGFILGAMIGLAFVMKAIPTAKYVVGRGPAYNFAHSFNAEHGGFLARHSSMSFATEAPSGHSPRGNHARMPSVGESNGIELV